MEIIHAVILGIVEGITEFLPISSTAHITLASSLLGLPETEFLKTFTIVIQLSAVVAICLLFFKRVLKDRQLVWNTLAAFIPTAVIGFILYKLIKHYLMGNIALSAYALIIGGIIFLIVEHYYMPRNGKSLVHTQPTIRESVWFGFAQALAVIPGVSRSGAIIVYGLLRGYSREVVTLFAFLLAVPTMAAAAAYDIYKSAPVFNNGEWGLLIVGSLTSFVVAYGVSKWFIQYISQNSFKVFGWYRIVVGIAILFFVL